MFCYIHRLKCSGHGGLGGSRGTFVFKVLQSINLKESFRNYHMHREDFVMRFKKNFVEPFQR